MALPFPINHGQYFIRLWAFIAHNNASEVLLAKRLRQPVIAKAKELIRVYGLALLKARDIASLSLENLPSLRTNNIQLSKLLVCSTRAIQRHINKLIETGVITREKWHGSNSSYEIWINPQVLPVKGVKAIKKPQKGLEKQKMNNLKISFLKMI